MPWRSPSSSSFAWHLLIDQPRGLSVATPYSRGVVPDFLFSAYCLASPFFIHLMSQFIDSSLGLERVDAAVCLAADENGDYMLSEDVQVMLLH